MNWRRWFRPWLIAWSCFALFRNSRHLDVVIPILAVFAVMAAIIYFAVRVSRKPDVVYEKSRGRAPSLVLAGARCLICRHEMTGEVIYCGRCHTPHHRECFTYTGACSVFGCGSRKAA